MKRRTTVEIDEDVLGEVQALLGTSGLKETMDEAFAQLLRRARQRRLTEELIAGELIELNPQLRDQMWR